MKKIISGILVFIMLAAFSVSAFAAANLYYIDELGLEVSISDDYDVITRDTPADDPVFERIGVTKEYFDSYAESGGTYFNALDADWEEEIHISTTDISAEVGDRDFSQLTNAEIESIYTNMKYAAESNSGSVSDYEICEIGQLNYMKVYRTFAMDDMFEQMYFTVVDGNEYYITLSSYLGEVTAEQEIILFDFVSNIKFDNAPEVTEPVIEETEPVIEYTEIYPEETEPYTEPEYEGSDDDEGMPWWGWLLIILGICAIVAIPVVIIVVIIIIIVAAKKKKKKKAAMAENTEKTE